MFKHRLLLFIAILIFVSCLTKKNYSIAVAKFNPQEEGVNFINSLKQSGVDTIISYYDGCSGCVLGYPANYYVFWTNRNKSFVTKFNEYSKFNTLRRSGVSINYITSVLNELMNEKLKEPTIDISHYNYNFVTVVFGKEQFQYEIKGYEKSENENSIRSIFIDKIRSSLFEINPSEWTRIKNK
jgi:hypothetical protein